MQEIVRVIKDQGIEHFLFVGATIISAGIHFIYSIYVKAYVTPLEYGIYSTCLLLQTYMSYLQLGSLNAFNRDYPQLVGANKEKEAVKYRNTVFSFLLSIYSVSLILIVIGILIIGNNRSVDNRFIYGFIFSAVITVMTIIENYGNYRCRIDKGFKYTSIVTLLELLSIPIGALLIPKLGYYAIYITSITAMIIGIAFYFRQSYRDFEFLLDRLLLKEILISGTPLLVNGLIWTVVNSIDKFVILGFMDTEALGVYGIAQNAFSYMVLIPSAMSQLFYVKMGKEYGANGSIGILIDISFKFSTILAAITSMIAMIAYFLLPVVVETFMPNYSNGVSASQILIIGLSIYAVTLISGNILTILKKNLALLKNSVCMCFFNVICSMAYILWGGVKIENVALGTATSYIFYSFVLIYQVYKYTGCSIVKQMYISILPVSISLVPGLIIYNIVKHKIAGLVLTLILICALYIKFWRKQLFEFIGEKK